MAFDVQTWRGRVAQRAEGWKKSEWDRTIEMYERSLETMKRLGDVHGIAQTWDNLGLPIPGAG